jgi:hypothetical protein
MAAQSAERDMEKSLEAQKVDDLHVEDLKSHNRTSENEVDYSGATSKTNAVEIRLVRKLDMRIMPILWMMYFLNYVGQCGSPRFLSKLMGGASWIAMLLPMLVSTIWKMTST